MQMQVWADFRVGAKSSATPGSIKRKYATLAGLYPRGLCHAAPGDGW